LEKKNLLSISCTKRLTRKFFIEQHKIEGRESAYTRKVALLWHREKVNEREDKLREEACLGRRRVSLNYKKY